MLPLLLFCALDLLPSQVPLEASGMFDGRKAATLRRSTAPSDWHVQGYSKYNATAWFRRRVSVSAEQLLAAKAGQLRLALGPVASADITYLNGKRIGAVGRFGKQGSCVGRMAALDAGWSAQIRGPHFAE